MVKDIMIVVPSRSCGTGREHNVERFIQHWMYYTEGYSDLCVSLDEDDHQHYNRYEGVVYTVNPNERLVPKLNRAAKTFCDDYKYIAFFGDDHVIRSSWEKTMIDYCISNGGVGICYGNDLLQQERLPTAVFISTNIIKQIGYMIPTCLQHMYADNFWLDIGKATNCLKYFPDVIWEHMHPDIGKAVRDKQYGYAAEVVGPDQSAYNNYINSDNFTNDINKINKLYETSTI